jgi:hypothetical protein
VRERAFGTGIPKGEERAWERDFYFGVKKKDSYIHKNTYTHCKELNQ